VVRQSKRREALLNAKTQRNRKPQKSAFSSSGHKLFPLRLDFDLCDFALSRLRHYRILTDPATGDEVARASNQSRIVG
jgi:hypothetical protein